MNVLGQRTEVELCKGNNQRNGIERENGKKEKRKSCYRTPSENGESLERPFEFDNVPSWVFKMFPRKVSAFDALISRFSLLSPKFDKRKKKKKRESVKIKIRTEFRSFLVLPVEGGELKPVAIELSGANFETKAFVNPLFVFEKKFWAVFTTGPILPVAD